MYTGRLLRTGDHRMPDPHAQRAHGAAGRADGCATGYAGAFLSEVPLAATRGRLAKALHHNRELRESSARARRGYSSKRRTGRS